jgi:formate dehydrogenase major subunit
VLGTNNVDSCARVCHAPSAAGLAAVFGTGAATSSFDDIERTRTILVCGANATENHPIVGARIKQAKRAGANLIVIDPRRIELAEWADVHLQLRPGTTVPLLNAIASVVVEERLVDEEFLAARVDGLDKFEAHVAAYAPEQVAATCGVDAADVRRAARLYAGAKPSISFHGLGVTEHTQGTEGVMCLANLALLTGNVGKPGAGVNPLRGQNNVQGAAHMGCEPSRLPGYAPLAEHRDRVGAVWGAEIPPEPGLDAMQMIDAAATGEVAALWVVGWDILLTQPDTNTTARSLAALEALVVEDLFLNETAREYATVFLPAAGSFEKDGTFMNSERRIQRVRRAVDPPGEARPDWRIACDLAAALGRADLFAYGDPEEIWEEIQQVWQPGSGISYPRIEEAGLQWPCPADDHPGTAVLHGATFGNGETRTALRCIGYAPTPEAANDEFPFLLVTGRTLYGFNAGTMTGRSATARLRPTDRLEINPADAVRGGMEPGAAVTVVSRYGEATLPAEVTERVPPGMLFATFHDPRRRVNALTGPNRDPYTHTPEYKVTAVRIARAPA